MCESEVQHLNCPTNYHLRIEKVYYGREDNITCPHTEIYTNDCKTPENAFETVLGVCNGREKCVFEARSESLGDSCPDTFKSAGIQYVCQSEY